jgi:Ca2+-binding EF-hand superfamily protein
MYDFDEDGYLGRAELLTLVECQYRTVGDLGEYEEHQLSPEERVEYLMNIMDLDGDDRLSRQEFELGVLRDMEILDALNLYSGLV